MVVWKVLDADCDEETRQANELGCLTSLYEVVKLSYFHPSEQVVGLPLISSSASWGRVAVALDEALFVLGDNGSSLLFHMSLEKAVSLVLWAPGGDFLMVGDVNAKIHYIHVATHRLLISRQLPVKAKNGKVFVGGHCSEACDGTLSVSLATSCGQIFSLNNLDNEALSEGLTLHNEEALKSVASNITLTAHTLDLPNAQISCVKSDKENLWMYCSSEEGPILWTDSSLQDPQQSLTWTLDHHSACHCVIPLWNGRYLVLLNEDGTVTVMCGVTGLPMCEANAEGPPILYMKLLQEEEEKAQLIFLLQDQDSKGCLLRIVSFPGFSTLYELGVSRGSSLVSLGEDAESILFLEPELSRDTEVTMNIKMKSIVDGVPEARLAKLLVKRKFKEAEDFCGYFQLDVEEVHKAKARYLCDLLNPWQSSTTQATLTQLDMEGGSSLMEELLSTLGKIRDAEFVTTLCITTPMTDLPMTKRILMYAKERLAKTTQSEEGDEICELMQKVCETSYRLYTFETVFPSSDIQHWLVFSQADMLEECLEHLAMGNLDVVSTFWHRHKHEFSHRMDEECVAQVLESVPHNIPSQVLCHWLPKNILADLVMLCRTSLDMIAIWADEWVKRLEVLEKAQWPTCGLNLANTVISVLENVSSDFLADGTAENTMTGQVAFSPSVLLQQLQQTAHALQDLQVLASKFRIKIKLNQYTQDDKMVTVTALLDCLVFGEEVAPLMDGFLKGYFVRHQLDPDKLLSRYVMETLAASDQGWWVFHEAPWEDKLYAIINVMSDAQLRAECLLECVHVAPVPWSEGTQAACQLGLSLNTSLTSQLEDQRNMVGLKLVLRRYSLHLLNINNPRNAKIILRNIVSRDEPTVLEDALCVVNSYRHLSQTDAYFHRAVHLLHTRDIDGTKQLLLGLGDALQKLVCQQLIMYMTQTLLQKPVGQKMKEHYQAVTKGVTTLESVLTKWSKSGSLLDEETIFTAAPNLYALQTHYDLYPTLREIENKDTCKAILKDQVTAWYKGNICDLELKELELNEDKFLRRKSFKIDIPNPVPTAAAAAAVAKEGVGEGLLRLQWLASLLGVARADLLSHLASLYSRSAKLEEAIQICQKLLSEPSTEECSGVVYQVVRLVVDQLSHSTRHHPSELFSSFSSTTMQERETTMRSYADLITIVKELVSAALLHSHPDVLHSLLELGSWCQVAHKLFSECHMEGVYTHTGDTQSGDSYTTWKFSPLFCDASIPIEDHLVLPVVTQILKGCLTSPLATQDTHYLVLYQGSHEVSNRLEANPGLTTSLQALVGHLHERGQDLLALQLCLRIIQQNPQSVPPGFTPDWKQMFTILLKVIGASNPDITLAIGLLLLLPNREALKVLNELIKRFGLDYTKLLHIGTTGKDFCSLLGLSEVKGQFEVLLKRAQWGKRLAEMNVSFKDAFKGDQTAIMGVIKSLVSHPGCTFSLLYEYCEDFSLDVTDSLLCYLQATLHSWSPVLPDKEPPLGEVVHVERPLAVLSKCEAIITRVKSQTLLYEMLSSEIDLLSPYNYELIHLVLKQLISLEDLSQNLELHQRGLDVISFLETYARQSPPNTTEVDEWISNHPQSLGLPPIAKYRLPFHQLYGRSSNFTRTVEAELSISILDTWLPASHILKLNKDHLCLSAINNTVSKTLELEGTTRQKSTSTSPPTSLSSSEWRLCSSHGTLLSQIDSVISKIQDYKLAAACLNLVVNRLPPGADKVAAVKKSCQLVQNWKENTSDPEAASALVKIENRYQQLANEHALHKHGLAEPQYLALTRTPVDLISALYQHPALSSLSTLCTHNMPGINACVTEICNIAHLQKFAILLDLLEKWLPSPADTTGAALNDTVTNFQISLDPTDTTDTTPDNTSLSRVIYLLRDCPQDEAVSYLLNRALSEDTSISASHCLRALRCLLAIADEATIQEQYPQGVSGLRKLLKVMTYVSRLEALGHASSVQQFNSMDKNALVEGLWHLQRHNPKALCLIADICLDYKVMAASLWGALLMQLTRFVKSGQVETTVMERVLVQLKSMPHLWVVPALTTAWETLIAFPFTKAVSPVSESTMSSCVHSVDLLLRHCPVTIPLAPLLQHCSELNLPLLALTIAAADKDASHDLQSMIEAADTNTLKTTYLKLKPKFAVPKRAEELLERL